MLTVAEACSGDGEICRRRQSSRNCLFTVNHRRC